MPEHTPEPWAYGPENLHGGHYLEHRLVIARDIALSKFGRPKPRIIAYIGRFYEGNDEDARRIVACVNACKGIPIKKLEDLGPAGLMQLPAFELLGVMRVEPGPTISEHLMEPKT